MRSERRRVVAGLAWLGGLLLIAGLGGLGWSWRQANRHPLAQAREGLAWVLPSATPFQPQGPTLTAFRPPAATLTAAPPAVASAAPPEPTPAPGAEFAALFMQGADRPAALRIAPPAAVNGGRELAMHFTPAGSCPYGSGLACLSRHLGGRVTLLTIHSGLGGEGEVFRAAVEGSGLNLAFFSLPQIQRSLAALSGAPAALRVGEQARDDLTLARVVRVPPRRLAAYFSRPFDEALAAAAEDDPAVAELLAQGGDLLLFEICGWQLPGEAWAEGVTPSTGSVYLGFIAIRPLAGGE